MASGIIFGGYLLSEEEFLSIFEEWYKEKSLQLKIDLQAKIILPLEKMIIVSSRINTKGKSVASVRRVKGQYDALKIYLAWEEITRDFFGNGKVNLIAAAKFEGSSYQWTNTVEESSVINASGINIRKKGLDELQEQMKDFESIYAAQDVQEFLNSHYNDLLKTLGDYTLSRKEAAAMHGLLEARKSALNNANFHFTGSTYDRIVFSSQRNAEGKRIDAFMNHIGKYNNQLFSAMSVNRTNANSLENIDLDSHGGFNQIFGNTDEVQPWLVDSLNNASWLSGGDVIVVNDNGAVIYNIQLKSTGKGKTFDLAASFLLTFAKKMTMLIDENNPKELARLMFDNLKTTTANDFVRTENFYESEAYKMIEQKLGLKFQ